MSNLTYVTSGTVFLGGCSNYTSQVFTYYKFPVGSFVYNKHKATMGIYEQMVIKKIKTSIDIPLYVDTYNAYWNENELVSESDARALVQVYLELQDEANKIAALNCFN